ncbi:MAG: Holliday junction branch migration protein RuvA [Anaerolineae bacterium]|nr:Holliday junction branch migration protein RuvA [Anaerolineae bacterium]
MIAHLAGEVLSSAGDHIIVDVGGVGLRVYATAEFCRQVTRAQRVSLHTHLVVREDSLTLYGFETDEERELFLLLLGVNGVGPRSALAVLSSLSPDVIRRAVLAEQGEIFTRVPGIGKKTGQAIVIHLQGKIKGDLEMLGGADTDVDTQVLEALTSLGYSIVEGQAALQSIPRDTPQDVEMRLRLALQYFSG